MSTFLEKNFPIENDGYGDTVLRLAVETLDTDIDDIEAFLYRNSTGEKEKTSRKTLSILNSELCTRAYKQIISDLSAKRYNASRSEYILKDLLLELSHERLDIKSSEKIKYGSMAIQIKDKGKRETEKDYFFPYLLWQEGSTIGSDSIPSKKTHGWKLSLSGFKNLTLGFAAWNDEEGIKKLKAMMEDEENLKSIAALVDPGQSLYLTATIKINKFLSEKADTLSGKYNKKRNYTYLPIIRSLAKSYQFKKVYDVRTMEFSLDEALIAYAFETPSPSFRRNLIYPTQRQASKRFPRYLKRGGFRIIEPPLTGAGITNIKGYTWVTPFTEETWRELVSLDLNKVWEYQAMSRTLLDLWGSL